MCRVRVKVRVRDFSIEHPIEDFQDDLDLGPADLALSPGAFVDGFFEDIEASATALFQQFQEGMVGLPHFLAGTGGISQQAQAGLGETSQQAEAGMSGPSQQSQAGTGGVWQPLTFTSGLIQESINAAFQLTAADVHFHLSQGNIGGVPQQPQSAGGVSQSNLTDPLVHAVQQPTAIGSTLSPAAMLTMSSNLSQFETILEGLSQQSQATSIGESLQQLQANISELSQQAQAGTGGVWHPLTFASEFFQQSTGAASQLSLADGLSQAGTGGLPQQSQESVAGVSQSSLADPFVHVVQQPTPPFGLISHAAMLAVNIVLSQSETIMGGPSQQSQVTSTVESLQQPQVSTGGLAQQPQVSTGGLAQQPQVSTGGLAQQPQVSTGGLAQQPQVSTGGLAQQPQVSTGGIPQLSQPSTGDISQQPNVSLADIFAQTVLNALEHTTSP